MKNKRAKQMMLDCGNDELLAILMEQRIFSMLYSDMRSRGFLSIMETQLVISKAMDKFAPYFCVPTYEVSADKVIHNQINRSMNVRLTAKRVR